MKREEKLIIKILEMLNEDLDNETLLTDCASMIKHSMNKINIKRAVEHSKTLRGLLDKRIRENIGNSVFSIELLEEMFFFEAPHDFDSYCIALELNRDLKDKFYVIRRKVLHPVAKDMQDIEERTLKEYFLSKPPRVGKTTIGVFFMTWAMGRKPNATNLYVSYSDDPVKAFYKGVLDILTDDETYNYKKIFPNTNAPVTDVKKGTISIGISTRYTTLTCRSLSGSLTGAVDCNNIMMIDDTISGIEEAKNPQRVSLVNEKIRSDLTSRAKETCVRIYIGTRWTLYDPIGNRIRYLEEKGRTDYKVVNIPALNENDESNFNYPFEAGISTETYRERRDDYDNAGDQASWLAVYQQEPIERLGALFDPSEMRYFNGSLPSDEYLVKKYATVDIAWGGGDYLSMPVIYEYNINGEEETYVVDTLFNNQTKEVTRPLVIEMIKKHKLNFVEFEANNGGHEYADIVAEKIKPMPFMCSISSKKAPGIMAKNTRILMAADEIKKFYYLLPNQRVGDYSKFMVNLQSFTTLGKNAHDDAPDSLAIAVNFKKVGINHKPVIFARPF